MAAITKVNITHGSISKTIALFPGLQSDELIQLLKSVFNIQDSILGIQTDDGLIVPIALVSKQPTVLPTSGKLSLVIPYTKSTPGPIQPPTEASTGQPSINSPSAKNTLTRNILDLIQKLEDRGTLSAKESQSLKNLLKTESKILSAAYSVALSADDSEYLVEIFRDVADSLSSEEGRSACEAQDEVLLIIDRLFAEDSITESHLLYLRHLVLIRDDTIADAYDEYQENPDVYTFARKLFDLVNTQPFELDTKSRPSAKSSQQQKSSKAVIDRDIVVRVVKNMLYKGKLTGAEASVLIELAHAGDEFVIEGFNIYKGDESSPSFEDYLLRCVQKEIDSRLDNLTDNKDNQTSYENTFKEDNIEEDNDEAKEDEEDEGEDGEEDDDDYPAIWKDSVPDKFVKFVFDAAMKERAFAVAEAAAICDLYQSGYDMVRAAWEVYGVNQDKIDFIDTLCKIVRGIKSSKFSTSTESKAPELVNPTNGGDSDEERKQKALAAVTAAKRELLKHSLEMMVKQSLISAEDALSLFKRCLEGDRLVDAAIEAYAADRNVTEFLDTLLILAKHSEKDLTDMLQFAKKQSEKNSSDNAAAENSSDQEDEKIEARIYIRQVIIEITEQKIIGSEIASLLLSLLSSDDERLFGAYEVYCDSQDLPDFIDSILRIAQHEVKKLAPKPVPESKPSEDVRSSRESPSKTSPERVSSVMSSPSRDARFDEEMIIDEEDEESVEENDDEEEKQGDEENKGDNDEPLLSRDDQVTIVQILVNNSPLFTPAMQEYLNEQINKRSEAIQSIFLAYEKNKDAHSLKTALIELCSVQNTPGPVSSEPVTEATNDALLTPSDQKTIVNILASSDAITVSQHRFLDFLIEQANPEIKAAFLEYEKGRNVNSLLKALFELLKRADSLSTDETVAWSKETVRQSDLDHDDEDSDGDDDEDNDEDNEEEEDDENENDDDEPGDAGDEEDREFIEKKFLSIIQSMRMDRLESSALRLAIARGDSGVKDALEQYRQNRNDEDLRTSLRNIANDTIEKTRAETEMPLEDDDDDIEVEDVVDPDSDDDFEEKDSPVNRSSYVLDPELYSSFSKEDQDFLRSRGWVAKPEGDSEHPQANLLGSTLYRANLSTDAKNSSNANDIKVVELDEEEYGNVAPGETSNNGGDNESDDDESGESDEDDEEKNENATSSGSPNRTSLTSQAARNHVFPLLVSELSKEGIITSDDSKVLLSEFSKGNEVVNAALDVYDLESDMVELVDTLLRFTRTVAV